MRENNRENTELRIISVVFLLIALVIIIRLFILQVIEHDYYSAFALSTHEIYQKLYPKRGSIYFQDSRSGEQFPAAVNRTYYQVYAVPKEIGVDQIVSTSNKLAQILNTTSTEEIQDIVAKLSKVGDPYEPIAKKMSEEVIARLDQEKLAGIYSVGQNYRYYPENEFGGNILGFSNFDDNNLMVGNYGIEGYWNEKLAGSGGFLLGEKGARGSWIALAKKLAVKPQDGADIILTIDRALQYQACRLLWDGWKEYQAKSAALVMMNPKTGAVLAMCSLPDFDPNNFSKVEDQNKFNNTTVFSPYEPGSVIKAMTMAAGIDLGLINYDTTFTDPCVRKINNFEIHNAQDKCYGRQTMTQVLENSINTGAVWVEEKVGHDGYGDYLAKFGFGEKTGVGLTSEMAGDISSLKKKGEIYGATASFGQGITATPLQVITAFSAIANGGQLPKPFIVDRIQYPDGRVEKTEPVIVENTISERAARILTGMLISVIDVHIKSARVDGYLVAGKTGTAQIAGKGGFIEDTNHTFVGYAPANNPKVAILIKYEMPQREWAEATAVPVFQKIMKFTLDYYGIEKERK